MKFLSKLIKKNKLFLILIIFLFQKNINILLAGDYEIFLKESNLNYLVKLLKKADKENSPRIISNKDGTKSIIYQRNNFQKELNYDQLIHLLNNSRNFSTEQKFIKNSIKFLNKVGLSVILSEFKNQKGSATWIPNKKTIKINKEIIKAGSLTFAQVLNHEMIHTAQSCKAGSLTSYPELIGLSEKMSDEKNSLLSSAIYKNLSKYEISLEKEAYSHQEDLSVGKYLINRFC